MNIDNAGRRKGALQRKARQEATPDVPFKNKAQAEAEFARRMGNRRYDEDSMVVKFKRRLV